MKIVTNDPTSKMQKSTLVRNVSVRIITEILDEPQVYYLGFTPPTDVSNQRNITTPLER